MEVTSRSFSIRYTVTIIKLGGVAQSVTFLIMDGRLTANPGVTSLILARSNTFVDTDHEIISIVTLPSVDSFRRISVTSKYVNGTS